MSLSAVVVNFNGAHLLGRCLASLRVAAETAALDLETVVVDNGSTDGSRALVARDHPDVRWEPMATNAGFGAGVNRGVARTTAPWILCLNNDAEIAPDGLRALAQGSEERTVGALALQMRFAHRPDLINSAGIAVDVHGTAYDRLLGTPVSGEAEQATAVFGASAGAALYRRAMLEEIGGFDERFFLYLEDVDLAWRAQMNGWQARYVPGAVVYHQHSASARHGSPVKYFHVGRNRMRVLAKNADGAHLRRHALGIVLEDLAYVAYVAARDRTLSPLRGRIAGLRDWRAFRDGTRSGRRPVSLAPRRGYAAALARRRAWQRGGTGGAGP